MLMQEDIVTKLLDFLVAPHATNDALLAEKEKVCQSCCKYVICFLACLL